MKPKPESIYEKSLEQVKAVVLDAFRGEEVMIMRLVQEQEGTSTGGLI